MKRHSNVSFPEEGEEGNKKQNLVNPLEYLLIKQLETAQATFDANNATVNSLMLGRPLNEKLLDLALEQRKEAADNLKSAQEKVDALVQQLPPLEKPPLPTTLSFEEFQAILNDIQLRPALEFTNQEA